MVKGSLVFPALSLGFLIKGVPYKKKTCILGYPNATFHNNIFSDFNHITFFFTPKGLYHLKIYIYFSDSAIPQCNKLFPKPTAFGYPRMCTIEFKEEIHYITFYLYPAIYALNSVILPRTHSQSVSLEGANPSRLLWEGVVRVGPSFEPLQGSVGVWTPVRGPMN